MTRLHPLYGCREARARLTDYLEDALGPGGRLGVESHLAGCEACRHLLRQTRRTLAALPALPRTPAPAHLRRRLLRALRGPEARTPGPSPAPRPPAGHGPPRPPEPPSGPTGTPDAWATSRPA